MLFSLSGLLDQLGLGSSLSSCPEARNGEGTAVSVVTEQLWGENGHKRATCSLSPCACTHTHLSAVFPLGTGLMRKESSK